MKKMICWTLVLLVVAVGVHAQTQQGQVKTRGRMVNGQHVPGKGLGDAIVQVQGRNAVKSRADGKFSFPVAGQSFVVQDVQKSGYLLVDADATSRTYHYSSDPLCLIMETPKQLTDDRLMAERKIRNSLNRQLQKREAEIEALKAQNRLSQEEYLKALSQIFEEQDNNVKLVREMAQKYAKIDYDQIDAFNRQVAYLIENGELAAADSLLNTKGDISSDITSFHQLRDANERERDALRQRQTELDKSVAYEQLKLEDIAQRCYSKFEIHKMMHRNDSAAYYLELRTKADTTNVDWLMELETFYRDYLADYQRSLAICKKCYQLVAAKYGEQTPELLPVINCIGVVHYYQGEYQEAERYFQQALTLAKAFYKDGDIEFAQIYGHLGDVYQVKNNLTEAETYYKQSLAIYETDSTNYYDNIGMVLNSIGALTSEQGDRAKAIEWYEKALEAFLHWRNKDDPAIAMVNINIGFNLKELGRSDEAFEYYHKAYTVWKNYYGENHPHIASYYNNLGALYDEKPEPDYQQALSCYKKAVEISISTNGEKHPNTGLYYNSMAFVYAKTGEYAKAIECYKKTLTARIAAYGESHPAVARTYQNMGIVYDLAGDNDEALHHFEKALEVFGSDNPDTDKLKKKIAKLKESTNR